MRSVFIGTVEISWHCLRAILEMDEVLAIYTMPDERSPKISAYKAFDDLGEQYGVPVHKTATINDPAVVEHLRELNPDIIYCIGWPRLVKEPILSLPPKGCVGIHSSLLPKYRGGAPVNWGIIHGEPVWGISLMYLGDGPDIGDIIGQESFEVGPDDTCGDVYDKATEASIRTLRKYVPLLGEGIAPRIVQDDSQATLFYQRKPKEGELDWSKSARDLHNWVRAITHPYPGAFTFLEDGSKVKIWKAREWSQAAVEAEPGTILRVLPYEGILVQCRRGQLLVQRLQRDGEIEMPATVWAAHLAERLPSRFVGAREEI